MDTVATRSITEQEYSTIELRKILQQLFPHRRLVLSQFTFFVQSGVAQPTGDSYRRGRRCYRFRDILPIAAVLALKEEGIPLKNISSAPSLLQQFADEIFERGEGCLLMGYGEEISLNIAGLIEDTRPMDSMLAGTNEHMLFWSFDVGKLARQLCTIRDTPIVSEEERKAA